MTWLQFLLSLATYEVFLVGTQWLFLGAFSVVTTVVFTAFFLAMTRAWKLQRPFGSST